MGFAASIRLFAQRSKLAVDVVHRKAVLDIYTGVVLRTPVDTGRLRANYQIGDGVRPEGTIDGEWAQASLAERGHHKAAGVMKARGAAVGAEVTQALAAVEQLHGGTKTFIVNNLPYALPIEQGHSQQAPRGMAVVTVKAVAADMARIAREAREAT